MCSLHHRPISDDYDAFKPCFFDEVETEEEFYDVPAPSEDIWKKFELLPTPPRSPKHETSYPAGPMNATSERLQMVSDILEPFTLTADFSMFPEDCALCSRDTMFSSCVGLDDDDKEVIQNLKSNLIQDCMWSGHLGNALEAKVKEMDSTAGTTSLCNAEVSVSTTVCVNPQSVFPYPLNEGETANTVSLGIDTPSDSDDDEDDEDDDEDEEEVEEDVEDEDEEIDVVSVGERHGPISDHRYTVSAPAVSVSAHVAAIHNYTAPHPTTVKSEPASPSSGSSVHSKSHSRKRQRSLVGRPPKRPRLTLHLSSEHRHKVKSSGRFSAVSSRSSSDSEDCSDGTKRSQHNILERKRRNDLKSSFHILRDNIPELSSQERAPKVVILRKAADYITQLKKSSQLLQAEQERLRLRREQLKQKLKLLQRHL